MFHAFLWIDDEEAQRARTDIPSIPMMSMEDPDRANAMDIWHLEVEEANMSSCHFPSLQPVEQPLLHSLHYCHLRRLQEAEPEMAEGNL